MNHLTVHAEEPLNTLSSCNTIEAGANDSTSISPTHIDKELNTDDS